MVPWLTVIGIGEDGFSGLGEEARHALRTASVLFGGQRHLEMVSPWPGQERIPWPSPFSLALDRIRERRGQAVCVLASGDPMFHGVGASLTRIVPARETRVIPAPSSLSLAAARMGWPLQDVTVLSLHGRPLELAHPHIHPDARLLVLSDSGATPSALAALLRARGFGASTLVVLEHLGGDRERRRDGIAATWMDAECAALNIIAVECHAQPGTWILSCLPGLPDDAFEHDGQLTKRDIRAMTLARLAPSPGGLLWDVGAGCGSIGIEWMRAHPACRTIAIESKPRRQAFITRNRNALGVPTLHMIPGSAPDALEGLETPDAIFIGGGLTTPGTFDACWEALKPGGRLVANAVTLQSEALVVTLRDRLGGELTRLSVAHAAPLGEFEGWRTAMPVTTLSLIKP